MVKYEAVRASYMYGDEMAMRPICERVNKIVARRRKNEVEPTDESEIIIALRFLRERENVRIIKKESASIIRTLCKGHFKKS